MKAMKQHLHLAQHGDAFTLTLSKKPLKPGPGSILSARATRSEMRNLARRLLPGRITVEEEKGQPLQVTVTPTDRSAARLGLSDALEWYYIAGADFTCHHEAQAALF